VNSKSPQAPVRVLLWKEWRESWWLLVLMAILPAATLVLGHAVGMHDDVLPALALLLISFVAGARLFAGERAAGTMQFMKAAPVARKTLWTAKVALPLVALATAMLLFALTRVQTTAESAAAAVPVAMLLASPALLGFALATLCSVVLDRPVTALATGFVLFVLTAHVYLALFASESVAGNTQLPSLLTLHQAWIPVERLVAIAVAFWLQAALSLVLSCVLFIRWVRD